MRIPPFDLAQPASLAEAVDLLEVEGPQARVMAGGTDLVVALKQRTRTPRLVVSLSRVSGHDHVHFDCNAGLGVGALAKLSQIASSSIVREHYPVLAAAAAAVGSPQVRNWGTLGGNLCLDKRCWYYNQSESWREAKGPCSRAGGETCYVVQGADLCYAIVSADTATALLALEADLLVVGASGRRRLSISDFFAGLGNASNVLGSAELLEEIVVPPPAPGTTSLYARHALRGAIDYPIVQLAVVLQREGNTCIRARIAVGAVTPNPLRVTDAEELLAEKELSPELIHAAVAASMRQLKPIPYIGHTPEYKRLVTRGALEAALLQAAGMSGE